MVVLRMEIGSFLSVQRNVQSSSGLISVSGHIRSDSPDRVLVITVRHKVNNAETIEQLTLTFDEFYEIAEIVRDVEDRLYKAEEVIL